MTLKELWESQGYSPAEIAGKARISVTTLYKLNRKDRTVLSKNVARVCSALGISRQQFEALEADTDTDD